MKTKIEVPEQIVNNMFIGVIDDKNNEKIFFVMKTGKGNISEAPTLYGYFLNEIIKDPSVLDAHDSLADRLYFNDAMVKEYRFLTEEQKSKSLSSIQESFNDFRKKTSQSILDKMVVVQNFILSMSDGKQKEKTGVHLKGEGSSFIE